MKKILVVLSVLMIFMVTTSCTDKYQREQYEQDIDVSIQANPTSIAALEEEITKIAYEHDDGGILTHANLVYKGKAEIANQLGTIDFTFCRNDEETQRGTIVIVTYDMASKKATKVSYEQGNGYFTQTSSEPINEQIMVAPFADLFETIKNDASYANKLDGVNVKLTIECTSENITITIL